MNAHEGDQLQQSQDEGLESGLLSVLPGVEFIDRDLELDPGGRRADLVGVDANGHLVLAFRVQGTGDEPLLSLLDAIRFTERNRELFLDHFQHERLQAQATPVVALVAEQFDSDLAPKFDAFRPGLVRLIEMRRLNSARGARAYFVPVYPQAAQVEQLACPAAQGFLQALPNDSRALAHSAIRRIQRADEDLQSAPLADGLSWSLEGREVCTLRSLDKVQGQLSVEVGSASFELREADDVGHVLEKVLEACLGDWSKPTSSSAVQAILTPEEIEAFQQ